VAACENDKGDDEFVQGHINYFSKDKYS